MCENVAILTKTKQDGIEWPRERKSQFLWTFFQNKGHHKGSFLCLWKASHTLLIIIVHSSRMSQIVDQRLFELVQLVSLSRSFDNESRRSFSFRSTRQSPGPSSRHPSRQIVAFTASLCGRLVIFAAADLSSEAGEGHSNNGNEVQTVEARPFIGAALLSKSQDSSPTSLTTTATTTTTANCDSNRELVEAEVLWLPWFQDTKYRPTCLTLSPESDFCLIGCENGSLFIISTKTLCPGFDATRLERDLNHKEWTNKKTHRVFPIDSSLETKGKKLI